MALIEPTVTRPVRGCTFGDVSTIEHQSALLESSFFAHPDTKREQKRLAEQLERDERRKVLRQMLKVEDEQIIETLIRFSITPTSWLALSLVPLMMVVWADGEAHKKEKAMVFLIAKESGILPNSEAHRVLEWWLSAPPSEELFAAWKTCVKALLEPMNPIERKTFRDDLLGRANRVARSAGGIFGVASISREEQGILDTLAAILDE